MTSPLSSRFFFLLLFYQIRGNVTDVLVGHTGVGADSVPFLDPPLPAADPDIQGLFLPLDCLPAF